MVGELKVLLADVGVELFIILSSKGEFTTEEGKEKNSEGPYVSWGSGVLYFTHDFRRHV